jgi:hypothetical protein
MGSHCTFPEVGVQAHSKSSSQENLESGRGGPQLQCCAMIYDLPPDPLEQRLTLLRRSGSVHCRLRLTPGRSQFGPTSSLFVVPFSTRGRLTQTPTQSDICQVNTRQGPPRNHHNHRNHCNHHNYHNTIFAMTANNTKTSRFG